MRSAAARATGPSGSPETPHQASQPLPPTRPQEILLRGGPWLPVLSDCKLPDGLSRHLRRVRLYYYPGPHPCVRAWMPFWGGQGSSRQQRRAPHCCPGATIHMTPAGAAGTRQPVSQRPEPGSPRSQCEQGWFLPESLREGPSCLFRLRGLQVSPSLWPPLSSLCLHHHMAALSPRLCLRCPSASPL